MKIFLIVLCCIIGVVVLALIYIMIDFTYLFVPLTPLSKTDESKLMLRDGVLYTQKDEPFTGTAVFKGYIDIDFDPQYARQSGKRIAQYKDGLKDGMETIYHTNNIPYTSATRTTMHSKTGYKQGVKHGMEIINFPSSKIRKLEIQYSNGLRNGLCKEYHYIDSYRKAEFRNNIGPLKLEAEYRNGVVEGFYHTFTQYGDTSENFTIADGKIIDGRVMAELDTAHRWRWYKDGELSEERIYDRYGSYANSEEPPLTDNTIGGVLLSETFYHLGQMIEERIYNPRNQKVRLHKKLINGQLIEIFNSETGVDRRADFPQEE